MPCRVGITTNPDERKASWEKQVVGLKNWRILSTYRSRAKAQEHVLRHAASYGCHAQAGGPNKSRQWHVYKFEYTRVK